MDLTRATWRTSTYSANGGNTCVEVGTAPRAVAVRDSTDPRGPALAFSRETWRAFTRTLKTGPDQT